MQRLLALQLKWGLECMQYVEQILVIAAACIALINEVLTLRICTLGLFDFFSRITCIIARMSWLNCVCVYYMGCMYIMKEKRITSRLL